MAFPRLGDLTPLPIRTRSPDPFAQPRPPLDHVSSPWSSSDSGYGSEAATPEKPFSTPLTPPSSSCTDVSSYYTLDGSGGNGPAFPDGSPGRQPRTVRCSLPPSVLLSPPPSTPIPPPPPPARPFLPAATPNRRLISSPFTFSPPFPLADDPAAATETAPATETASGPRTPVPRRGTKRPAPSPLRTHDRFIHPREAGGGRRFPLSDRFHLTMPADDLTFAERVLRSSEASRDAFGAARLPLVPLTTFANRRRARLEAATGTPPLMRARTTIAVGERLDEGNGGDGGDGGNGANGGNGGDEGDVDGGGVDGEEGEGDHARRRGTPGRRSPGPLAHGSVWRVGASPPLAGAVDNGRGTWTQTRTTARFYTSEFVHSRLRGADAAHKHAGRVAAALDFDRASRILPCQAETAVVRRPGARRGPIPDKAPRQTAWDGTRWVQDEDKPTPPVQEEHDIRPLRILSAPNYRDDFYCSLLAYSPTSDTVTVGLGDQLYSWSERAGATFLNGGNDGNTYLTALAFSSAEGGRSILAFGRSNGVLGLMALSEGNSARLLKNEASPVSCLSWRPTCTRRLSKRPATTTATTMVSTEDLLVGTDSGQVLYYVVEWPDAADVAADHWPGDVTLVARIAVHQQQVCGLAWAQDGGSFATGGNDNACCFFYTDDVLPLAQRAGGTGRLSDGQPRGRPAGAAGRHAGRHAGGGAGVGDGGRETEELPDEPAHERRLSAGTECHRWEHGAAVKAIAFCPWQAGLLATGGGSNDRCVHFFHTTSGAALASIFVSAQVTSLMWSTTRRELAVTFGFTLPGHNVRVAVYSWPACQQTATIAWDADHRALYGISCGWMPGMEGGAVEEEEEEDEEDEEEDHGDDDTDDEEKREEGEGETANGQAVRRVRRGRARPASGRTRRTLGEGCVAVASSDESIKFYELWPAGGRDGERGVRDRGRPVAGSVGMLGGSDILEDLEGIQKEGDIIR